MTASNWYFVVGRFNPSTSLDIIVNGTKVSNVAGIPATLFNSTANFIVMAYNNGLAATRNDGKTSLCFLCAAYLDDVVVDALFAQTRALFGV